jgi:arylsulfatase
LILADDVGWFDISAYHRGIMGTRTPNFDRVADGGAMFTDAYARAGARPGGRRSSRGRFRCVPA